MPHRRLVKKKLSSYGIRGKVLDWVQDFLTGRKQQVVVRGATSDWSEVLSGVPQGSVLGPLCFLVYIADINFNVESTVKMFAADTKVYRKIDCDADRPRLQRDLDVLHEWSETWLLRFNIDKCKVMHFGQGEPIVKYTMNEINLEGTKEEKDLGVLISDNLQPLVQCANAAKKAMSAVALLQKSFKFFDEESFRILYKTYVRSHIWKHVSKHTTIKISRC